MGGCAAAALPPADGWRPASGLRWQIPHHAAEQIGRHFAEVTAAALRQGFQLPQGGRIKLQLKSPGKLGGIEPVAIRLAVVRLRGIRVRAGGTGVGLQCQMSALDRHSSLSRRPAPDLLTVTECSAKAAMPMRKKGFFRICSRFVLMR